MISFHENITWVKYFDAQLVLRNTPVCISTLSVWISTLDSMPLSSSRSTVSPPKCLSAWHSARGPHSHLTHEHRTHYPGPLWPITSWPTVPRSLWLFYLPPQRSTTTPTGIQHCKCMKNLMFCTCTFYTFLCKTEILGMRALVQKEVQAVLNNTWKPASCLHLASIFLLPTVLQFPSQPLYRNMLLSHLSITSIQSIFIRVASHSLSQSISLPCECWCCLQVNPSLSVSVFFFVVCLCVSSFCLVRNS